jgi:hypothetical protein
MDMATNDGINFFFLSDNAELFHAAVKNPEMKLVAERVVRFCFLDDALIYQQGEELKIMHLKESVFTTAVCCKDVGCFWYNPGLNAIWCIKNGHIWRKGAPFALPNGEVECCADDRSKKISEFKMLRSMRQVQGSSVQDV